MVHCEGKHCEANPDCKKDDKTCIPHKCKGPDCNILIPKKHCDEKNKFCHPAECIGDGCKNKPSDCTDEEIKNGTCIVDPKDCKKDEDGENCKKCYAGSDCNDNKCLPPHKDCRFCLHDKDCEKCESGKCEEPTAFDCKE